MVTSWAIAVEKQRRTTFIKSSHLKVSELFGTSGTQKQKRIQKRAEVRIGHETVSCWWFQSLWKIWKSIGMMTFPTYRKIKNVPNHQPGISLGGSGHIPFFGGSLLMLNQDYIITVSCSAKKLGGWWWLVWLVWPFVLLRNPQKGLVRPKKVFPLLKRDWHLESIEVGLQDGFKMEKKGRAMVIFHNDMVKILSNQR